MEHSTHATTIDEYITQFPKKTQQLLQDMRQIIHAVIPNAEEGISYAIPAIKHDGHSIVYFAGYKNHVSIYPIPKGNAAYQADVDAYRAGKGTMRFPLNKPLPHDIITQTVTLLMQERH